jgi:ADP-ribose pyrophosphatase YjhB (NUDIX family)
VGTISSGSVAYQTPDPILSDLDGSQIAPQGTKVAVTHPGNVRGKIRPAGSVLLCDHRLSGLWLPTGHVEPGEHPLDTVRREAVEELGVATQLDAVFSERPFFLTMAETVGPPAMRHVDVSLWFALAGRAGQPLHPDQREFAQVRWWTVAELRH